MAAEHDIDLIVRELFFPQHTAGTFVEVGAAGPHYLSISASFRALGWKIIAIEPNPVFCRAHEALGHDVLEYACSDKDADDVDFYVVKSIGVEHAGGTVTFESFSSLGIEGRFANLRERVKDKTAVNKILVKVRRLDTILATHAPNLDRIDILAIDVEGWELSVMRGLDFDRYRPKVVILENLFNDEAYRIFMRERGYSLRLTLDLNEVFALPEMVASRDGVEAV